MQEVRLLPSAFFSKYLGLGLTGTYWSPGNFFPPALGQCVLDWRMAERYAFPLLRGRSGSFGGHRRTSRLRVFQFQERVYDILEMYYLEYFYLTIYVLMRQNLSVDCIRYGNSTGREGKCRFRWCRLNEVFRGKVCYLQLFGGSAGGMLTKQYLGNLGEGYPSIRCSILSPGNGQRKEWWRARLLSLCHPPSRLQFSNPFLDGCSKT